MCHVSERDVSADRSHIFQQIHNWPDRLRRREPIKRNVRWCNVLSKKCNTDNFGVRCLFLFYFTFLAHATCSYFGAAPLRLLRPLGSLRLVTRHIVHFIFGSVLALSCLALFFPYFFFIIIFLETEKVHVCEQLSDTTMNRGSGRSN